MSGPSSPGWVAGQVPTADQWNTEFAAKVDYPAPVNQGGTGGINSASACYNTFLRSLISTTPFALVPLTRYGLKTNTLALTLNLPLLSSLLPGDWIDLADVDYNAATHNVTLNAAGSDVIALNGSSAASQTLSTNGARATLIVNSTAWRLFIA